jgi:hypothetical protein
VKRAACGGERMIGSSSIDARAGVTLHAAVIDQGSPTWKARLTLARRLMTLGAPNDDVAEVLSVRSKDQRRRTWHAAPKGSAAQTLAEAV